MKKCKFLSGVLILVCFLSLLMGCNNTKVDNQKVYGRLSENGYVFLNFKHKFKREAENQPTLVYVNKNFAKFKEEVKFANANSEIKDINDYSALILANDTYFIVSCASPKDKRDNLFAILPYTFDLKAEGKLLSTIVLPLYGMDYDITKTYSFENNSEHKINISFDEVKNFFSKLGILTLENSENMIKITYKNDVKEQYVNVSYTLKFSSKDNQNYLKIEMPTNV